MRYIFTGQSANAVSAEAKRNARALGTFLVRGKMKYRESGGGTGTLTWRDSFTGETIGELTISANSGSSTTATDIPFSYTVELSAVTGGCTVDVTIDGDAG